MLWFFLLSRSVVWFVFTIIFDIKYEGLENIPQQRGGYIIASNHTSYLDPVVLAFKVRPWVHYMAKDDLIKNKALKLLFTWLGIIPVSRGSADFSAIDKCADLVKNGHVLGIFPEGTRYPQNAPGRPKSGMALIAKMTRGDVLPCSVSYQRPIGFRSKITVRYAPVIPFEQLELTEDSPRALKRATKCVWDKVLALLGINEEKEEKPYEA